MFLRNVFYLSALLMLLGVAITAQSDVPQLINYQGILTSGGNPVTTPVSVIFSIHDQPTGGTLLWSETQQVTPDAQGRFSVLLGAGILLPPNNPLNDVVFDEPDRWLEVQVVGDPPMIPRAQIVTAAYAFRIATVDGSTGGIISGDVAIQSDLTVSGKATIGPGHTNAAPGGFVAGVENYASGSQSTVGGGNFNGASGAQATVGGGYLNGAANDRATVSGGHHNVADIGGMVGGGGYNKARGAYSVVSGGGGSTSLDSNSALGDYSSISGGKGNLASNEASTVSGGSYNTVSGNEATVGGGENNTASNTSATVGGGVNNTAGGVESTIAGGSNNTANNYLATIGGGNGNDATGGSAITIAGGLNNTASAGYCVVGGGKDNTAGDDYSTVGGGLDNTASDQYSTVSGGRNNTAGGQYSTAGGGYTNKCYGDYSVIPGGDQDTIASSASHAMTFGRGVFVNTDYRVVFFDGSNHGRLGINRDDREGNIDYPVHVGTNSTNGNGAHLTNGGTWTNGSSREFKESFESLNGDELLHKIATLQIEAWNYKGTNERHIGPVAEEFVAAFNVGAIREDGIRDNKYLSTIDVAGVALAAVKELHEQNQKLEARVTELQNLVGQLLERQK